MNVMHAQRIHCERTCTRKSRDVKQIISFSLPVYGIDNLDDGVTPVVEKMSKSTSSCGILNVEYVQLCKANTSTQDTLLGPL